MQIEPISMYCESDLIPISALQHYAFCPRQCALIHIEQRWEENYLTAKGRLLHERTHAAETEFRDGVLIVRGLRIRSLELGLIGQADVVEFHPAKESNGVCLSDRKGTWCPFPVEYKRGKPKKDDCDKVQLCAQAMCIEEMLSVDISEGALFYGMPRRRSDVIFNDDLRSATKKCIGNTRTLLQKGETPPASRGPRCRSCSLQNICMPEIPSSRVLRYISEMINSILLEKEHNETS